jgi:MscS family membrane protein
VDTVETLARQPWVIAAAVVVAGFLAGRLLLALAQPLLARLARRSSWEWDDPLVAALAMPLSLLVAIRALHAALPWLPIDGHSRELVAAASALLTTALVIWAGFRTIDVVVSVLSQRAWARERPASRSLLAIGGRIVKAALVALSAIMILAFLGVSVASLVAGLGIGGLALALASQKTVENLFGTVSIGVDQPLREGDFVRVAGFLGTVESIGLRSTRLRTLDRTLVTIPNGQLADAHVESYTVRDRILLSCTLRLVYGTTVGQLRAILGRLEGLLRDHPRVWPDAVVARFSGFGASSLDLELMAWFQTSDWNEFRDIRQEIFLATMAVVEEEGSAFALPSQTIHLAAPPAAADRA